MATPRIQDRPVSGTLQLNSYACNWGVTIWSEEELLKGHCESVSLVVWRLWWSFIIARWWRPLEWNATPHWAQAGREGSQKHLTMKHRNTTTPPSGRTVITEATYSSPPKSPQISNRWIRGSSWCLSNCFVLLQLRKVCERSMYWLI